MQLPPINKVGHREAQRDAAFLPEFTPPVMWEAGMQSPPAEPHLWHISAWWSLIQLVLHGANTAKA